ncbi:MAG: DUF1499 domain-containing protein [bacterium]|jgi:uncharacterized protein (DUF1499 family)|nr:DUF1499 domain-containing protein [bacterium]
MVFTFLLGILWARSASRPVLGLRDGLLLPLPASPNCVATQSGEEGQRMDPIPFAGDRESARRHLIEILTRMPNATLVKSKSDYLWVVFRSAFFGFPDDVEFQFSDTEIHFRSAARLGYSDLGVNRKRMSHIIQLFHQ